MAKKDKAKGKDKSESKAEKTAEREFKFGVEDLAEKMGIKPASVRVQLRNHSVEKAGKSYGWDSKAELDEVISTITAEKTEGKGKSKDKADAKGKGGKAAKGKKNKKDKDDD